MQKFERELMDIWIETRTYGNYSLIDFTMEGGQETGEKDYRG